MLDAVEVRVLCRPYICIWMQNLFCCYDLMQRKLWPRYLFSRWLATPEALKHWLLPRFWDCETFSTFPKLLPQNWKCTYISNITLCYGKALLHNRKKRPGPEVNKRMCTSVPCSITEHLTKGCFLCSNINNDSNCSQIHQTTHLTLEKTSGSCLIFCVV